MKNRGNSYIYSLILIGIVVVSSYITSSTPIYFSDNGDGLKFQLNENVTALGHWNTFGTSESTHLFVDNFNSFVQVLDEAVTSDNYGTSLEFSYYSSMGGSNDFEQDTYYLYFDDIEGNYEVNVTTNWDIGDTVCLWYFSFCAYEYDNRTDTYDRKAGLAAQDGWLSNTGRFNIIGNTTIYTGEFDEVGLSRSNVVYNIKRVINTTYFSITQDTTVLKTMTLVEATGIVNCFGICWEHSPDYTSGTSTFDCIDIQGAAAEVITVFPPINNITTYGEVNDGYLAKIFGLYLLPVYFTIILVPIIVFSIKFARKRRTQEREETEKSFATFGSGYSFSYEEQATREETRAETTDDSVTKEKMS